MSLIVDRRKGADYKQVFEPLEKTAGMLWYEPDVKRFSVADGQSYNPQLMTGFVCCGVNAGGSQSAVDKLDFLTDAVNTLSNFVYSVRNAGAVSGRLAGYVMGGYTTTYVSTIGKLNFSNYASAGIASTFANVIAVQGYFENTVSTGYSICGSTAGGVQSVVYKLLFDSDTTATLTNAPTTFHSPASVKSGTAGYCLGGYNTPSIISIIHKMLFSNETTNTITSNIGTANYSAGRASAPSSGYYGGGITGAGNVSTVRRFAFGSELTTDVTSTIAVRIYLGGLNSSTSGYFPGGMDGTNPLSTIARLLFNTEAVSSLANTLSVARWGNRGLQV